MTPVRTVLDTNVLLSALLFPRGRVTWLRDAWRSTAILPLASRETVIELMRVLAYPKFRLADGERRDLLADYLPFCETVDIDDLPAVRDCRDAFDRRFLELALAGRADALVTGDGDLLDLAADFAVPILNPSDFARQFGFEGIAGRAGSG